MEKKKISLRGISEILSEKELKNVMGGSDYCSGSTPVTVLILVLVLNYVLIMAVVVENVVNN